VFLSNLTWTLRAVVKCCIYELHIFSYRNVNHHMQKLVCAFLDSYHMKKNLILSLYLVHLTEKKHHHDHDEDSGMGPSIFTDTKSTMFSEVNTSSLF